MVGESVAATGRVLVVHEDVLTAGFGGRDRGVDRRRVLLVARRAGPAGRAPSTRHVAYEPTLEDAILPQVDDVTVALRDLLAE